jgi:ribulose-5-phosphate 4-epimerase/fuculose-1-phosphate aldolase
VGLESLNRRILRVVELVNQWRPLGSRTRDAIAPNKLREALRHAALLVAERGLVAGTLGEISMRLSGGKFLLTAKGTWFPQLSDDDLLVVSISGDWTSERSKMTPHAEWHREIYRSTEANAILLGQPVSTTLLAAEGLLPDDRLLIDAYEVLGEVCLGDPINVEIAKDLDTDVGILLLPGKGVLAWGDSVDQVISAVELLERWCELTIASRSLLTDA